MSEGIQDQAFGSLRVSGYAADQDEIGGLQGLIVDPNRKRDKKNTKMQKTDIEIEVNETVAYSRRSERFENYCPTCQRMSEMATPQVASILSHTTEREIYKLVETGDVHFVETDRVLVCLNSIPGYQSAEQTEGEQS